jgi:hypothetical protein
MLVEQLSWMAQVVNFAYELKSGAGIGGAVGEAEALSLEVSLILNET